MGFYRWLGCFLLLLAGSGVSLVLFAYERRRCRQAEGFLALVSLLRSQIDCFSIPIGGILKKCDPRILRDCGLDDGEDLTDMPSLLSACHLLLPEEECALLADFARQLGGGYREEQLRSCSSRYPPPSCRAKSANNAHSSSGKSRWQALNSDGISVKSSPSSKPQSRRMRGSHFFNIPPIGMEKQSIWLRKRETRARKPSACRQRLLS